MSDNTPSDSKPLVERRPLAPWLQDQLEILLSQRGHAWLLSGPSGLGQFELALALARAWLCEAATPKGACGHCGSCHAIDVQTHADLRLLLPETLFLSLGWPLDQKIQEDLDTKKRKPSKEIKVDAARSVVAFSQLTRSRGATKVVLVFPAERMNGITSNTLLKTLEEPPGEVRFILATESAQQLLPTIRSRCQSHSMRWPAFEESLAWLQSHSAMDERGEVDEEPAVKTAKSVKTGRAKPPAPQLEDLRVLLAAAGGRPADALAWVHAANTEQTARDWRALPKAMARGQVAALTGWAPTLVVDALQKICHDVWAVKVGAEPRFFNIADLPPPASMVALSAWSKELAASARSAEHPFNPGLMLEALVSRAQQVLTAR